MFDKRDSFLLPVVLMHHLDSNIPSKVFYSAFGAEILRPASRPTMLPSFNQMKQGVKIDCQPPLIRYLALTLMYFISAITLPFNLLNHC